MGSGRLGRARWHGHPRWARWWCLGVAAITVVGVGGCDTSATGLSAGERARGVWAAGEGAGAREEPVAARSAAATISAATPSAATPSAAAPRATATPTTSASHRPSASPTTAQRTSPSADPGCPQGEYQRQVERDLARLGGFGRVIVDGRQSPEDCAAIKKFQRRYGIVPAEGRAGPVTADVARRLAETDTSRCEARKGTTFCVDLTRQTAWVMRNGRVIMKPTVVRTGMPGYATATGHFQINARNLKEWSRPYKVWLPYWQHFTQGMGFHETTTYLHDKSLGSHGCVNLLPQDARRMWELGSIGTHVHVFGRRPGT